jgi:hypothetical protein
MHSVNQCRDRNWRNKKRHDVNQRHRDRDRDRNLRLEEKRQGKR